MTFTVKDFIKMLAMNQTAIEICVESKTEDPTIYIFETLVHACNGKRVTCDEEINLYADVVVLEMETVADADGTICATLFIDPLDKNRKIKL